MQAMQPLQPGSMLGTQPPPPPVMTPPPSLPGALLGYGMSAPMMPPPARPALPPDFAAPFGGVGVPAIRPPVPPGGLVETEEMLLRQYPPYSRVLLVDLQKNLELNNKYGIVVPQSVSVWPETPGCLKVRLSSGQEVAVKPGNMQLVAIS